MLIREFTIFNRVAGVANVIHRVDYVKKFYFVERMIVWLSRESECALGIGSQR